MTSALVCVRTVICLSIRRVRLLSQICCPVPSFASTVWRKGRPNSEIRSIHLSCLSWKSSAKPKKITKKITILKPEHCKGDSDFLFRNLRHKVSVKSKYDYNKQLVCDNFKLTPEDADMVLSRNPEIQKDFKSETIIYLGALGLTDVTFKMVPWVATLDPDEIYSKVCKLAESFPGFDDINVCAPLLKYTLQSRLSWWKRECMDKVYPTRFHFFAGFMNIPLKEAMGIFELNPFLMKVSFKKMESLVKTFLSAGMSEKQLLQNLYYFKCSPISVQQRIQAMKDANLKMAPGVFLLTDNQFQEKQKQLAGAKANVFKLDVVDYVMKRLGCDLATAETLARVSSLSTMKSIRHYQRIDELLDYLLIEKGIDPIAVVRIPSILTRSVSVVRARVEILESIGADVPGWLCIVYKSKVCFDKYVEKLKSKASKKDIKDDKETR